MEFDYLANFDQGVYDIAKNPTSLKHQSKPTCALALIELGREDIQKYSQFRGQTIFGKTRRLSFRPWALIVAIHTTIHIGNLECENGTSQHQGCDLCLLQIKCQCKFSARIFKFYAKIAHSGSDSMHDTGVRYAINLPNLEQFFNCTELLADTRDLLDFTPQILLPNLTFQKYETERYAGIPRKSLFNMQQLAQSAINNSQIFLDLGDLIAEHLEQNKLDLDHQTFSSKTIEIILIFLNPILVVCLIVGFAKLYWKFRTITAALLIIRPQGARSAMTQPKVWIPTKWPNSRSQPSRFQI